MVILSYHPGISVPPFLFCYRIFWGHTAGSFCVWLSSLSQELCGVLLLQMWSCSSCLGIRGRAGHRDCHNSQQRQQLSPAALGWRCQRAQPAPVTTHWAPRPCALRARQSPTRGFHSCPNNHISPECYLKKAIFRFDHLLLSSMEFSQDKTVTSTSINKRKQSKSGAGNQPESTSVWVSRAAAAERSLQ